MNLTTPPQKTALSLKNNLNSSSLASHEFNNTTSKNCTIFEDLRARK